MDRSEDEARLRIHPHVYWHRADLGHGSDGSGGGSRSARRIVSLVPSLSESLFLLGLGDRLVGVTEYCVHPEGAFVHLPKLGGTKDADVEAICATKPDLVIANQEENTSRVVRKLADAGIDVWVTYPRTVEEGVVLLEDLAALGASPAAYAEQVAPSRRALDEAAVAYRGGGEGSAQGPARVPEGARRGPSVFCPIWRDPWMTIGADTYIHDLIELCGGANVFANPAPAARGNPSGTSTAIGAESGADSAGSRRYPVLDLEALERAQPEVILLPDEPYAFGEADRAFLAELAVPAAKTGQIHLIDGTLVSWYGPRIAESIQVLASLFANA